MNRETPRRFTSLSLSKSDICKAWQIWLVEVSYSMMLSVLSRFSQKPDLHILKTEEIEVQVVREPLGYSFPRFPYQEQFTTCIGQKETKQERNFKQKEIQCCHKRHYLQILKFQTLYIWGTQSWKRVLGIWAAENLFKLSQQQKFLERTHMTVEETVCSWESTFLGSGKPKSPLFCSPRSKDLQSCTLTLLPSVCYFLFMLPLCLFSLPINSLETQSD